MYCALTEYLKTEARISLSASNHDDDIKWKHFPRYWPLVVTGEFPARRPVTWNFDVFFDLRLNERFSKQSWPAMTFANSYGQNKIRENYHTILILSSWTVCWMGPCRCIGYLHVQVTIRGYLLLTQLGHVITSIIPCGIKLLIQSQTSMA